MTTTADDSTAVANHDDSPAVPSTIATSSEIAVPAKPVEPLWRRLAGWLMAMTCAIVIGCYYTWLITFGVFPNAWPVPQEGYYGRLASAFAKGQTYLELEPLPELKALADPYDPGLNEKLRFHDALYYKDRYYLYWGPVPALLATPLKLANAARPVPDADLMLTFACGLIAATAALVARVRERLFPYFPWWTTGLAVLMAGLGTPMPFTMARPHVYETAIIGGQFFLIAGMFVAFLALDRRPKPWLIAIAAMLWGLAVGTRNSLAPAVIALAVVATIRLLFFYREFGRRRFLWSFATLSLPLFACAIALGVYNKVRFGSFTEFGIQYQLAGINFRKIGYEHILSSKYVTANLNRYLWEWADIKPEFPFVFASGPRMEFLKNYHLPPEYGMEFLVGIFWFSPFLWFAALPIVLLAWPGKSESRATEKWLTLSLLITGLFAALPTLFMIGSTMRYLVDASPSWFLLAGIGVYQWARLNRNRGWSQNVLGCAVVVLGGATVLFGVLLGMTGYASSMKSVNPELWNRMSHATSYLRP